MDDNTLAQTEEEVQLNEVSDETLEAAAARSTAADPTGHETGTKACC